MFSNKITCLGNSFLHPTVAMEKLGGWKSICTVYGSKSWISLGCREKTEEETVDRLSVL